MMKRPRPTILSPVDRFLFMKRLRAFEPHFVAAPTTSLMMSHGPAAAGASASRALGAGAARSIATMPTATTRIPKARRASDPKNGHFKISDASAASGRLTRQPYTVREPGRVI